MTGKIAEYGIALALCAVLGLNFLVYEDGLHGPFILDDFHNLKPLSDFGGVDNLDAFRHFVFGNGSGPSGRPVSMASFLLDDQYWPSPPYGFKLTNLLLHLLNGVLVFLLAGKLSERLTGSYTKARWIALIACSLWLLHPLNVSTALYVIQRMTQLAALFTLLGLWLYTTGRGQIQDSPRRALLLMTAAIFPAGVLAALSKENGALIFLFIAAIEFTVFARAGMPRPRILNRWLGVFVLLPVLAMIGYFTLNWGRFLNGYAARDFSLPERLLTEGRIVTEYLGLILAPRTWGMGIINDDITVSTGLLSPITTLPALLFLGALLAAGIGLRHKAPVASLGILWFFAGHLLESTFIPLELYFEHRNYLPMIGPLFAVAYYIVTGIDRMSDVFGKTALAAVPVLLVGLFAFQTAQAATLWGSQELLYGTWEVEHRESLRAKRVLAQHYATTGRSDDALKLLRETEREHPHDLAVPIKMLIVSCEHNRETTHDIEAIQARTADSEITDGLLPNLERLADLVTDEECGGTLDEFSELLYRVEEMPQFGAKGKIAARILWLHAEVETKRRQLDPTVRLLERAFAYQPTVAVGLKRAVILASAGLYEESLAALDQAEKADANRPFLAPSRMPELKQLRTIIERNRQRPPTAPAEENADPGYE